MRESISLEPSFGSARTGAADGGVGSNAWRARIAVSHVLPSAEARVGAIIELETATLLRINELQTRLSSRSHHGMGERTPVVSIIQTRKRSLADACARRATA